MRAAALALTVGLFGVLGGEVLAQYINGPAPSVTAGQFCAEMRGWIGMQRQGHTLRNISCSGSGHHFNVSVTID